MYRYVNLCSKKYSFLFQLIFYSERRVLEIMRELVSTVTLEMMEKHTQSNILLESMDSGQNLVM